MEFIATPDASGGPSLAHPRSPQCNNANDVASALTPATPATPATPLKAETAASAAGGGKQNIKDSFRALVFSPNASDPTYNGLAPLSMTPALANYQYTFPDDPQTVPEGRTPSAGLFLHPHTAPGATPDLLGVPTPYLKQAAEEAVAREVMAMASANECAPPTPAGNSSFPSFQTPFLNQVSGIVTPLMKQQCAVQLAQFMEGTPKAIPRPAHTVPVAPKPPVPPRSAVPKPASLPILSTPASIDPQPAANRSQPKQKATSRTIQKPNEQPIMMKPMPVPMQPFFFPYNIPQGQGNSGMYPVMMAPTMGYLPHQGAHYMHPQPAAPNTNHEATKKDSSPQTKEARDATEKEALTRELKKKTREAALVRFRQKKRERSAGKLIRYDCRKKLADARPRIKGRFVRSGGDDNQIVPLAPGT